MTATPKGCKIRLYKIRVIYLSADERFRVISKQPVLSVLAKYKLTDDFILYLGLLHKRKNIPALIKAYAQVKKIGIKDKLAIVGGDMGRMTTLYSSLLKIYI